MQGPLYDYLKSLGVTQPIDPELAADIDALVLARVKAEITSRAAHAPIQGPRARSAMLILGAPGTLDFLAPSINYSSCRDVVQLYSVRHSGDMARIRDTAPAICRGFVIFEGRHAKSPKGERRLALVTPAAQAAQHAS